MGSDSALGPSTAPMWAVKAHWTPQCAEAGMVCILTRRRDEGWGEGREGGRDLLVYTHPVWEPLLLCSTLGYSHTLLHSGQVN